MAKYYPENNVIGDAFSKAHPRAYNPPVSEARLRSLNALGRLFVPLDKAISDEAEWTVKFNWHQDEEGKWYRDIPEGKTIFDEP